MSSEQIVLPSANPRASYLNAVAVAAKGGWLAAELQKDAAADKLLKAGEAEQGGQPVLQLTLRMKRSQVPLLKSALAAAGLHGAEKKGARVEEAQQTYRATPLLARAGAHLDEATAARAAAPVAGPSGREDRIATANAAAAAAPPATAAVKAPEGVVATQLVGAPPPMAEKEAQRTEAATLAHAGKAEAAEEPLVQVTLLFPLAESPVPAARPAAAPASPATPE